MQELKLTPDAFTRLQSTHAYVSSSCWSAKCNATVQVIAFEKFESASLTDYMVCLSDGDHYVYGKLHAQVRQSIEQGDEEARVRMGSIVVLENVNVYQIDRIPVLILVVGALRVVGHAPETIGNPKRLKHIQPSETVDARPSRIWTPNNNCRISDLNPYQKRWTITARVTSKSEMHHWSGTHCPVHGQRQGNLFTCILVDASAATDLPLDSGPIPKRESTNAHSDTIKVVAFNLVADKFYPLIEEGKVYRLSNAEIQIARKGYHNDPSCEFELHLRSHTEIEERDASPDLPVMGFNLVCTPPPPDSGVNGEGVEKPSNGNVSVEVVVTHPTSKLEFRSLLGTI